MAFFFGSGILTVTPTGTNPTPINIGLVQEVTISVDRTLKSLYAQFIDPIAVGAGTRKWSGKAKVARFSGRVLNALIFGGAFTAGYFGTVYENHTVPATSVFTVTVTNSATFTVDQGVVYSLTGLPLQNVASGPTVGQYSYAAGVYTFAAADASAPVTIGYNYTVASSGQTVLIPQGVIGPTLNFGVNLSGTDQTSGLPITLQLFNCVAGKTEFFGTKLEDWSMPDFEFTPYATGSLGVGKLGLPDQF